MIIADARWQWERQRVTCVAWMSLGVMVLWSSCENLLLMRGQTSRDSAAFTPLKSGLCSRYTKKTS